MVSCNFCRGRRPRTEAGITILLIMLMVNSAGAAVLEVNSNHSSGIKSIVYPTIQGAIDGASDGDLIIVTAGTYYENLTISNKINLTITGAGIGSTIIQPSILKTTGLGHKYDPDMHVALFVNLSTNLTIQGMTISGNGLNPNAVIFWNAATGEIKNSRITDTSTLRGSQTGQGIAIDASSGQISSLNLTNIQVDGFNKNGIDAVDGNGGTSPGTITVNVHDGSITGVGQTTTIAQNGILFWNNGTGTVGGSINGVSISNLNYTPTTNEATGILGYSGGPDSISNSVFSNVESYIYASSNIDASAGNTFDGVAVSSATDAQLFAIEDMIFHKLDDAALGLVTIKPNNVYVTPASGSLQRGIDAVPIGGTVNVAPGTYTEQIDIGKVLTLIGADEGSTIIRSPASMATKFTTSDVNKPIVYVNSTAGVTLQQLTVDGAGLGNLNYRMEGIAFYNAGGTVDHVNISGILETPLSGNQHGVALYANNVDGTPRTLIVTNNTINDYQKNGMALNGAGLTATVTGNTVTGAGNTLLTAQNGIQIGYGAAGTISYNTVTGNSCSHAGDCDQDPANSATADGAAGILLYLPGSASIEVENNTLTGNQFGIWTVGATGVNLHNNNITGASGTGIAIWDSDQWSGGSEVGTTGSISNNNITSNGYGLLVRDYTPSGAVPTVVAHFNNIYGNSPYGAWSTVSFNATYNWWGADSGPGPVGSGSGDNVSTNALYDPWLPVDLIPPASVTDLVNVSYADNYINWTWTDPADLDFKKVLIYLDGVPKGEVQIGVQFYNATVSPGTYTIGTQTVDERGNINATIKTHTATTILPSVRFINGTVFESPDPLAGIPGVTVTIGSQTTTTNATGFYSFAVTDGSYSLTAILDPTYYSNSSIPVSTTGEAVVVQDIELQLKPTGTISGTVKIG